MLLAFTSRSPALKRARRIVVCLLHSVIQRCVETLLLPVSGEFRSFRATRGAPTDLPRRYPLVFARPALALEARPSFSHPVHSHSRIPPQSRVLPATALTSLKLV